MNNNNNVGVETGTLKELYRTTIECPVCRTKSLEYAEYLYDVPRIGKTVLSTGKCKKCGFKTNDARILEATKPKKIIIHVTSPNDLNILIVKSSSTRVILPELGIDIKPGPASQGYITTIEGVLHRVKEVLESVCTYEEVNKEACEKRLEEVEEAIDGKKSFRLIMLDPEGVSAVDTDKAVIKELSRDEYEEELEFFMEEEKS